MNRQFLGQATCCCTCRWRLSGAASVRVNLVAYVHTTT